MLFFCRKGLHGLTNCGEKFVYNSSARSNEVLTFTCQRKKKMSKLVFQFHGFNLELLSVLEVLRINLDNLLKNCIATDYSIKSLLNGSFCLYTLV